MPYKVKGKCVYKRDTGKKVGCTKGSVKKYLGALHANVHESEEDFDWAKEIVSGVDEHIVLINKKSPYRVRHDERVKNKEKVTGLPAESFLKITGHQDGISFDEQECKIVNNRSGSLTEYLLVFPEELKGDEGPTHCGGEGDSMKCHCREGEFGRCYWVVLSDMAQVLYYPNRRGFMNESEEDEFDWARQLVNEPIKGVVVGQYYRCDGSLSPEPYSYDLNIFIKKIEGNNVIFDSISNSPDTNERADDTKNNEETTLENSERLVKDEYWVPIRKEDSLFNKNINESEDDDFGWAKDIVNKLGNDYLKDNAWTLELSNGSYEEFEDAQKWAFEQGYKWRSTPSGLLPRKEYDKSYKKIASLGSIFDTDIRQKALTYSGNDFKLSQAVGIVEKHTKNNTLFYLRWNGTEPKLIDVIPIVRDKKLRETEEDFEWTKTIDHSQYLKVGQVFRENLFARKEYFFEIIDIREGSIKCEGFSWKNPDDKRVYNVRYDTFLRLLNKEMWTPLDIPLKEQEDDLEWVKDIVNTSPLEFQGKEILIDIRDLNNEERKELINILEPYILNDHLNGEDGIYWDNQCIHDGTYLKSKSISLHCGIEDQEEPYKVVKGLACCLNNTYEDDINKENVIPMSGRMLLNHKLNESKEIITEGRYDSITRKVVKDIMDVVKSSTSNVDSSLPNDLRDKEFQYVTDNLAFTVELSTSFRNIKGFGVNASISNDEDEDIIMVSVELNPTSIPGVYEELFYKLQETIRHEIQHFTQYGVGRTANLKTTFGHHKNKFEVEALVHGFYRRAKLERRPLDDVMMEDLDSEIERGNLTKAQAESLLKIWIDYAKKNLPAAIYSQE